MSIDKAIENAVASVKMEAIGLIANVFSGAKNFWKKK